MIYRRKNGLAKFVKDLQAERIIHNLLLERAMCSSVISTHRPAEVSVVSALPCSFAIFTQQYKLFSLKSTLQSSELIATVNIQNVCPLVCHAFLNASVHVAG